MTLKQRAHAIKAKAAAVAKLNLMAKAAAAEAIANESAALLVDIAERVEALSDIVQQ